MSMNAACWFEIYVQDMARAKPFYESVLGRKFEKLDSGDLEMWAFGGNPAQPGSNGALVRMPGFPSGGNSTLVYFACEDCATEAARVVPAGGKLQKGKFSIGQYGFVALAVDTEGNMFGLHSIK